MAKERINIYVSHKSKFYGKRCKLTHGQIYELGLQQYLKENPRFEFDIHSQYLAERKRMLDETKLEADLEHQLLVMELISDVLKFDRIQKLISSLNCPEDVLVERIFDFYCTYVKYGSFENITKGEYIMYADGLDISIDDFKNLCREVIHYNV